MLVLAMMSACWFSADELALEQQAPEDTATGANLPPSVEDIRLSPDIVRTDDVLRVAFEASDPDGDTVTTAIRWYVDDAVLDGVVDDTLDGGLHFGRGQTVKAQVTARDDTETVTFLSDAVVVANSPPTAPVAAIVPERAYGGTPLECFVQAASADVDGDPVRYTFSWTVDGSPFGAAVDDGERSTVPGDQVRPSQAWACTVVARDDADATPSATVSLETGTAIVDLEGPFGVPFIAVAPGTFTMGSDTPPAHGPAHEVTLTHAFWLGVTEVTQAQWRQAFAFDGNLGSATPSANGGCDDCPVESVSGYGFRALANAASRQAGLPECYAEWPDRLVEAYMGDPYACPGYRLPTEAEWEYVTGVGGSEFAGARDASQTCWSMYNASSTSPVATLDPNPLGFYDLCGNVEEMMHDWYADGPYPTGPVVDPFGPVDPNTYLWVVVRGGSWGTNVIGLYARSAISVSSGTNRLGVRLARTIP